MPGRVGSGGSPPAGPGGRRVPAGNTEEALGDNTRHRGKMPITGDAGARDNKTEKEGTKRKTQHIQEGPNKAVSVKTDKGHDDGQDLS